MAHAETTTTKTEPKPEKHEEVRTLKHKIGSGDHVPFGDTWFARIIAGTIAFVVVWILVYATLGSGDESTATTTTKRDATAQAQQPTEPWYKRMWITPDDAISPFNKSGSKSATPDVFIKQGQSPGAAPDPFTKGITGPYTNAACKGGKRSATLVPGSKPYLVDQYNACRVSFYVPPGALIEAMDEHGAWYRLQPGSTREVLAVRAVAATVNFSYTRCSKESPAGMLNWDCTLLTQYASQ